MEIAKTILAQLGGNRFIAMTGSKDFMADGNTLHMTLMKNKSAANRLDITLTADDLYDMRFFQYVPGRLNQTTLEWKSEKITEVKKYSGVFDDMLRDIFTEVTGMKTSL
ncbi:MAG: hypothetical protein FWF08_06865 [Oscillospiraceae bacterium]|nr:hypothetical protein [Oscillospiraceae bacterium]